MDDMSIIVKAELSRLGADIIGFGDLRELPEDIREYMPVVLMPTLDDRE